MAQNSGKFVCYYRVSTSRQGRSGLGLEAQREAVKTYLNGGNWTIVDEYTEVESGKNSDRPALEKALAAARLHRASLVVSKVDRLTRSERPIWDSAFSASAFGYAATTPPQPPLGSTRRSRNWDRRLTR
jgi:predicted site-specific integrase-resolvase